MVSHSDKLTIGSISSRWLNFGSFSSAWHTDTAVCHPDDISYHYMLSGWLSWNWYLIRMSYDNVILSSGWHTLPFLSHPDEIANFDFPQHAVAFQHFRTSAAQDTARGISFKPGILPLHTLSLVYKCDIKEVHGNLSHPFYERIVRQKHHREADTCRNSIPCINQCILSKYSQYSVEDNQGLEVHATIGHPIPHQ